MPQVEINKEGNIILKPLSTDNSQQPISQLKGVIFQGVLTIFLLLIFIFLITASYFGGQAATYNFLQNNWSGGQDQTNFPNRTNNGNNNPGSWTKFFSKDSQVIASSGGITLNTSPTSQIRDSQSDFDAGVKNQVDTSSTPGDVKLAFDLGDGSDGAITISNNVNCQTTDISTADGDTTPDCIATNITAAVSAGATSLTVASTLGFYPSDDILIIQMVGNGQGNYEIKRISSVPNSTTINLTLGTTYTYQSTGAQIIRVPQYTNVTITSSGVLTVSPFNGTVGGVLVFKTSDTVNVQAGGLIDLQGKGFAGGSGGGAGGAGGSAGQGGSGSAASGGLGENAPGGGGGAGGTGASGYNSNGGAGGAGGSGGTGSQGQPGASGQGPAAGLTSGAGGGNNSPANLSQMFLGSGGAQGAGGQGGQGPGGGGGGGGGASSGFAGSPGSGTGGVGGTGGAGGAGGGILSIIANNLNVSGLIRANGAPGSQGGQGQNSTGVGGVGGNGSDGDIRVLGGGGGGEYEIFSIGAGGGGGGGKGGGGGSGGQGGGGGGGGAILLQVNNISLAPNSVTALNGQAGNAGAGGQGGQGGAGGSMGETNNSGASNGQPGPSGNPGQSGTPGSSGASGKIHISYSSGSLTGGTNPAANILQTSNPIGYFPIGTLASDVLDTGFSGTFWTQLSWTETLALNTDITFEVRASDTFFNKTDSTPSWVSVGGTSPISSNLPSGRYKQWRATLTTNNAANTPILHSVTIQYIQKLGELWSSPFNTEDIGSILNKIQWTQTLQPNTNIKFQVRTGSSSANVLTQNWCGPDNGTVGCSSNTYFTDPNGSQTIDTDIATNQWFQYRVILERTASTTNTPTLTSVNVSYIINTLPVISINSASQETDGAVVANFTISDIEAGNPDTHKMELFYDLGLTLNGAISENATTLSYSGDAFETHIPSSGVILIDNEVINYTGVNRGTFSDGGGTFTGLIRPAANSNTVARSHLNGAAIYIKAVSGVTFSGTNVVCSGNNAGLGNVCRDVSSWINPSVSWTPDVNLSGLYKPDFKIVIYANDGNAANQVGKASSIGFIFDKKAPIANSISLRDPDGTEGIFLTRTNGSGANPLAVVVSLDATDDMPLQVILSNSSSFNNPSDVYQDYNPPVKNWNLNNTTNEIKTVYAKFKDAKGNESAPLSATIYLDTTPPPLPQNLSVQDTSLPPNYALTLIWTQISNPDGDFKQYIIERSKTGNENDFNDFPGPVTITNITQNYYVDQNLIEGQIYYYRVTVEDQIGNRPAGFIYSSTSGIPGGNPTWTIPIITLNQPPVDNITTSTATISWKVNQDTNSSVAFLPCNPSNFNGDFSDASIQELLTIISSGQNHNVTLIGLQSQTTYCFEVRSRNIGGKIGTCKTTDCAPYDPETNNYLSFSTLSSDSSGPLIQNVSVNSQNPKNAVISFSTYDLPNDGPTNSLIEFGPQNNVFGSFNLTSISTPHTVQLPFVLSPSTFYNFKIYSFDGQNNSSFITGSFTTAPDSSDNLPPHISNIQVSSITPYGATITWTTDESTDSFVEWGLTPTLGNMFGSENLVAGPPYNHSVILPPIMSPGQTIYFRVRSRDANNNLAFSETATFETQSMHNDNTPPVITNVQAPSFAITPTSALITWDTDDLSNSQVAYSIWPDNSYLKEVSNPEFVSLKHQVLLTNLTPGTRYVFKVISKNPAGLFKVDDNNGFGYSFSTPPAPQGAQVPSIINEDNILIDSITYSSVTIRWNTDLPSDSFVEYGFTSAYGFAQGKFEQTTNHSVTIVGLEPDTIYHFRVRSMTPQKLIVYSKNFSFKTSPNPDTIAPIITNVKVNNSVPPVNLDCSDDTCQTQATITWDTNEPADHIVEYGTSIQSINQIATSAEAPSTNHSVSLTGLTSGTTYYFQIKSRDRANNLGINNNEGRYFSFQTKADTTPPSFINPLPQVQVVAVSSATISWATDEDTTGQIKYSAAPDSDLTDGVIFPLIPSGPLQKSHAIILTNLTPGTQYYYQVISKDAAGNQAFYPQNAPYLTFTTLSSNATDTIPPFIKNVKINGQTPPVSEADSPVTITWDTMLNENDIIPNDPSSSIIDYGLGPCDAPTLNNLAGNLSEAVTQHSVTLNNLQINTTYCFQVRSVDAAGNMATNNNGGRYFSFTTAPDRTVPIITHNPEEDVGADQRTCVIRFTTSEDSTASIEYSTQSSFAAAQTLNITSAQKNHSFILQNLNPSTKYYYRLKAVDLAGNEAQSVIGECVTKASEVIFIQPPGEEQDKKPPKITNIQVVDITGSSATVKWTTDELSDSLVQFGTTTDYGETRADRTKVAFHQVTLTGLKPNTLYNFKVSSADSKGNIAESGNETFMTAKIAGPEAFNISDVEITSITATTAIIKWQTDVLSTSQIEYGPTALYGLLTEEDKQLVTSHTVTLQNLEPATSYHFRVKSKNQDGIEKVSQDFTFITLSSDAPTVPPVLADGPIVKDLKNNSATIFWVTDKPSNSIVILKEAAGAFLGVFAKEQEIGNFGELTSTHKVQLINLKPDTLYKFKVKSVDAKGNVIESGERTFRTLPETDIYSIKIEDISFTSAVISWKTSTKTTSIVEYGLDDKFSQRVAINEFTTDHRVKLENLLPGALYNLRIKGEDEQGSVFVSSSVTFETLGPPQILNLKINPLKETAVEITWNTDKETDSTIEYLNTATGEKLTKGSPELSRSHSIKLENLMPNTNYFFQILSTDVLGRLTRSDDYSFTTGKDDRPPVISQVKSENAISARGDKVQTIITWKTDEPATSQILYREGSVTDGKFNETPLDKELTVNHYVVLTSFKPGQIYRFKIKSTDQAGNDAFSSEFTLLTPRQKESIIDLIVKNFEQTFGFFKKLR